MIRKMCVLSVTWALALASGCSSNEKADGVAYINVKAGFFNLTLDGASVGDYGSLSGNAQLIVSETSSTVNIYVEGLRSDTEYGAYVHVGSCEGGGGHYYQNVTGDDIVDDTKENGLWPTVMVDGDGVGTGAASNDFVVTDDARSVVIHEPGTNARIACADLYSSAGYAGVFHLTNSGKGLYGNIEGNAWVSAHDDGWSKAEVAITGLTANKEYKTHVHTGDCASGGGGHYFQNVTGDNTVDDVAENGLWPFVNVNVLGYGAGWANLSSVVRFQDANSVVVHQVNASDRIACADLSNELLVFRSGGFVPTDSGDLAIAGRARLAVNLQGDTTVSIYVSGLVPETEYKIHVHNAVCESGGGGHYMQDVTKADEESNGFYPFVTTNINGAGTASVTKSVIARPDAHSVVIHDPVDSTIRIACADLL